MTYKDRFYQKYVSTHTAPREGEATLQTLKDRALVWEKTFARFLPGDKTARIVDLGCGYGNIVWWLQRSGFASACGVDISAEQIETGKSLGVASIEQGDVKAFLRDKKDFYDVIFARDVIEHFAKEEIPEILSLCCESLRNGGRLILQVPNAESPFGSRLRYGDYTHEIAFTASSLSQVLLLVGFGEIRFYSTPPIMNGPEGLVRFVLWKVIEASYRLVLYVEMGRGKRVVTQDIIAVAARTVGTEQR